MPPPAPPRKGLQPTIVDRLLDPESAGNSVITGYTVEKMYLAVRRDLEDLLNTLHPYHKFPEQFPETRDSVVTYGLPDLASIEAISTEQRSHIGKLILRAIHRFDRRLNRVFVRSLNHHGRQHARSGPISVLDMDDLVLLGATAPPLVVAARGAFDQHPLAGPYKGGESIAKLLLA